MREITTMSSTTPSKLDQSFSADEARLQNHRPLWRRIANGAPNVVVFTLLGGILYFGHHTGWKLPKLSRLTGAAAVPREDWCAEHLVPASQCVECNTDMRSKPKEFGFCRKHGVTECVIDHPELAQINRKLQLPKYDTVQALGVRERAENNSRSTLHKRVIQFTSAESALRAGIDVDVVQERPMSETVSGNGELHFDPTRVAHLSSRVSGSVAAVFKTIGDEVRPGAVLALVDAAQVGQTKSQFLRAIVQLQLRRANVKRLNEARNAIAGKVLLEEESSLKEAEINFIAGRQALGNLGFDVRDKLDEQDAGKIDEELRFLGIGPELLASLDPGTRTANLIPVRTPYEGVVVASDVVAGEVVDTKTMLFTVANPRYLWLTLNIRPEDAKYAMRDMPVVFRPDDASQEASGKISWLSPAVDERSRTLQARVKLENLNGKLRDKTFGTGRIILREEPNAIVVPREAVQSTSDGHFVFVRDKDYLKDEALKIFHVRQVRIGAQDDQYVELLAGALPGEVVATKGSPVLLAQLLRSNLGAGCACHDH